MRKRIGSALLLLALLGGLLPGSLSARAEEETRREGPFEYMLLADGATIVGLAEDAGPEVVFPETLEGEPVVTLDLGYDGSWNDRVSAVVIPASVTTIGDGAFYRWSELASVTFAPGGEGGLAIGLYAFGECPKLSAVSLPDRLRYLDQEAFVDCPALASVRLPAGPLAFGENVFLGCDRLVSAGPAGGEADYAITFPWTDRVPDNAFRGCDSLTRVVLPEGMTHIGAYAFDGCTALQTLEIPDSVTTIATGAFSCCGLSSLRLPAALTALSSYLFQKCTALTSVTMADRVLSIGNCAFDGCTALASLLIPGSVTSIGLYAFDGCTALQSVTAPDSVASIGDKAFAHLSADFRLRCNEGSFAESFAKKNSVPYETILYRTLQARVLAGGKSADCTIQWYDANGRALGTGGALQGADSGLAYDFEVRLPAGTAAFYRTPARQRIEAGAAAAVTLELEKQPVVTLVGRVVDPAGGPVAGAHIGLKNEGGILLGEGQTGADGAFSVELPAAAVTASVTKEGCFGLTAALDLSGRTGTVTLSPWVLEAVPPDQAQIQLEIVRRHAAEDPAQAETDTLPSAEGLLFTLTDARGTGIPASDFEVSGLTLALKPAALPEDGVLYLSAAEPGGEYVPGAPVRVVLDGEGKGAAQLTLTQKGGVTLGGLSGPEALWLLFDGAGTLRLSGAAQAGASSGPLDAGRYTLVLVQRCEALDGIPSPGLLDTLGLAAGRDYLLREVTVQDGVWTRLPAQTVPAFDGSGLSYVVPARTSVTAAPSGRVFGLTATVRVEYAQKPGIAAEGQQLRLYLPEGLTVTHSPTLDNQSTPYTLQDGVLTIDVSDREAAVVRVPCRTERPGAFRAPAVLSFTLDGRTMTQPLGAAALEATGATLNVPGETGAQVLAFAGSAPPGSRVLLYDNGVCISYEEDGRELLTRANQAGSWQAVCALAIEDPAAESAHVLTAKILHGDETLYTDSRTLRYVPGGSGVSLLSVTMYNTGDQGAQATSLSYAEPQTVTPFYRAWPAKYPSFTFEAVFQAEPGRKLSDVSLLTFSDSWARTTVPLRYDERRQVWVGTQDYHSFDDTPAQIAAAFVVTRADGSQYEVETAARRLCCIIDPSGFAYEALPSNRLAGIEAAVLYRAEDGTETVWDAAAYDQLNPQRTGADGVFYWDVPPGDWKVRLRDPEGNYAPADSSGLAAAVDGWLPVPPPQLEVNIGMTAKAAPTVAGAAVYPDGVDVTFSQYMRTVSLSRAVRLLRDGAEAPATLTALDAEVDASGHELARRFRIVPDDGGMTGALRLVVGTGAVNYAGTALGRYDVELPAPVARPTALEAAETAQAALHGTVKIELTLQPALSGRTIEVENLSPALLELSDGAVITGSGGRAAFTVTGLLPGSGEVRLTEPNSGLTKTVTVLVSMPEEKDEDKTQAPPPPGGTGEPEKDEETQPEQPGDTEQPGEAETGGEAPWPFTDVPEGHWAREGAAYMLERGLFRGTSDTQFSPNAAMTRAMLVTVLYRLAGEPAVHGAPPFADVPERAWYRAAVQWAGEAGVTQGMDGGFQPLREISREQLVTMLYRYADQCGMDTSARAALTAFPDAASVSPWAQEAMSWAVGLGLVQGDETGALRPGASATRAQAATILMRLLRMDKE